MRPDYRVNGVPCYEIDSEKDLDHLPEHLKRLATVGERDGNKVVAKIPRFT
ncbi:MAG: hypothetical protein ACI977_000451 [Candidatus Nanohaloarchaea archaeon]|jgi:hypothetical protein